MQIGFILSLIVAIVIAVFALRNGDTVLIDFLFSKVEVSQAIVIFVSAALGAVIVTILGIVRQIKLTIKIKDQSKRIKTLEESNKSLEERIVEIEEANKINKEEASETLENKAETKATEDEIIQKNSDDTK